MSEPRNGDAHWLSLDEVEDFQHEQVAYLIIGTGLFGNLALTGTTEQVLREHGYDPIAQQPTPEAIDVWNEGDGQVQGLFHTTCCRKQRRYPDVWRGYGKALSG